MARIERNFYPDDDEGYDVVEIATSIADDANVEDHFELWKREMGMLGFFVEDFELMRKSRLKLPSEYLMDNPRYDDEYDWDDEEDNIDKGSGTAPDIMDTTTGDTPFQDNITITSEGGDGC